MKFQKHRFVSVLLLVSGLLLSSLIPGGPIENRDFSNINSAILLGFNVYLTVLGLGSFLLAAYVLKSGRFAAALSVLTGFSYVLVYGVDLIGLFPQTQTPMSSALYWVEVAGFVLALLLIQPAFSLPNNRALETADSGMVVPRLAWTMAGISGIAIIVFATWSAMEAAV